MAQALLSSHSTHTGGMPAGTNGGRWHRWHTNGIELRLNLQGRVWDERRNSYGNDTGAATQKETRLMELVKSESTHFWDRFCGSPPL